MDRAGIKKLENIIKNGIELLGEIVQSDGDEGISASVKRQKKLRLEAFMMAKKLLDFEKERNAAGVDGKKGTDSKRIQDEAAARVAAEFEVGED